MIALQRLEILEDWIIFPATKVRKPWAWVSTAQTLCDTDFDRLREAKLDILVFPLFLHDESSFLSAPHYCETQPVPVLCVSVLQSFLPSAMA